MPSNPEMAACHLDDDGGCQVIAVEAADSQGHRQALWVRVGPVFFGTSEPDPTPRVWIEYQQEYMKSGLSGSVMIDPAVWRQLAEAINSMLEERGF